MVPTRMSLLQGTLDALVLKSVEQEARHGYGVAAWIRRTTDGTIAVEDGALYTSLHRLERRGWLTSSWGVSENNRREVLRADGPRSRGAGEREHGLGAVRHGHVQGARLR